MKKLLSICLIAIMSLTISTVAAQQPKKVVVETTQLSVKVDNPVIEKKIVKTLSDDKGVKDVKVDAKKNVVTVSYDKALVNDAKLVKELGKVNIKATVIKPAPKKK